MTDSAPTYPDQTKASPVSEALQQEMRHLRTVEGSARDPRDRIFLPLADVHFRLGEFDTAAEMLREGLTRLPDFVAAHVLMGRVLEARGDLDEAEETWAAARRLDPENSEALLALGRVLVGRGEAVGGELILRARALDPTAGGQEPDADLVSIAHLAPDEEAAAVAHPAPEEEAVPVAELAPDEGDVVSIADLAPSPAPEVDAGPARPDPPASPGPEASGGGSGESPASAEERASAVGDRRVVTRTLAELLAAQGQRPRAIAMYEELVARSPDDAALRDRLSELRESPEPEAADSGAVESSEFVVPQHDDEEVDHRLSRPDPDPDTPTPFAWTEDAQTTETAPAGQAGAGNALGEGRSVEIEATTADGEARIADYLGGLLARSPSSSSGDASSS